LGCQKLGFCLQIGLISGRTWAQPHPVGCTHPILLQIDWIQCRLTVVARAGDPAAKEKIGQRLKARELAAESRFNDVDDDT
jgi:hypothetical protein